MSRKRSTSRKGGHIRNGSPTGATTQCTRDEDLNIEEFMKDDMR